MHLAVVMSVAIILPCVPPARRMPREEVAPDAPVCARALAGCGCVHVQTDASHDCLALFWAPSSTTLLLISELLLAAWCAGPGVVAVYRSWGGAATLLPSCELSCHASRARSDPRAGPAWSLLWGGPGVVLLGAAAWWSGKRDVWQGAAGAVQQ